MPSLGLGLGLHKTTPLFSGLLDYYGGAAAAYSLRALSRGWLAGDVVEVRRDVDGGGDIHKDFTASDITSGAMLAWVTEFSGTANGTVSKWYDQSGNANDATQATTTAQPKIVDAGALVTDGLDFDGVDDYLQTALPVLTPGDLSVFSLAQTDLDLSSKFIWEEVQTGTTLNRIAGYFDSSSPTGKIANYAPDGANRLLNASSKLSAATQYKHTVIADSANASGWYDGAAQGSVAIAGAFTGATTFGIGRLAVGLIYFNGKIDTIIAYNSDQTANREGIEALI